jgi:hypothetical protein
MRDELHLGVRRSAGAASAAAERSASTRRLDVVRTVVDADHTIFVVSVSGDAPAAYSLVIVFEQSILTDAWLRHIETQEAAVVLAEEIARFSAGTSAFNGRKFLFRPPYAGATITEAIANVRMLGADAFGIG